MRLQLIPSVVGRSSQVQFLSSYLLNDTIAIDGGSLGLIEDLDRQRAIRHLLLTHAHLDHVASIGVWLDNVYDSHQVPPTIYCLRAVADVLRTHYFNNAIWPDLLQLPTENSPAVRIQPVDAGVELTIDGVTVTPIEVEHAVPAAGFVLSDSRGTLAFSGDTGPTHELWRTAAARVNWTTTVLEVAFPNAMQHHADIAGHLTPRTFAAEVAKMPAHCRVFAMHLKSTFRNQVMEELRSLNLPNCHVLSPDEQIEI